MYKGSITDINGIQVGCTQNAEAGTGCTVVLCPPNTVGGVDVRGSAPGTRETDLLASEKMIQHVHAFLLSGGSAFGLEAAGGVMHYLEEKGIGFNTNEAVIPIVPAAVIYDLSVGSASVRPNAQMGYQACKNANGDGKLNGMQGAGTGASVSKILGMEGAVKSGQGTASVHIESGLIVGAIVVLNAFGDVYSHEDAQQLTGPYDKKSGKRLTTQELLIRSVPDSMQGKNTTIAVVATNAQLTKPQANKLAQMAQNGLARTIVPVHTMLDGDTVFAAATGELEADVSVVGMLAAEAVARAVINAAVSASPAYGLPNYKGF